MAVTISISCATTTTTPQAWDWRLGYPPEVFDEALKLKRRDLDPILRPIARPVFRDILTDQLGEYQDRFPNKVVVKGPCRETSGFQLQSVYVARFLPNWLEKGDKVHLLPHKAGDQGQPCLIFSSETRESFMITLKPTRASVNADLFTNIPPWEEKAPPEYIELVEKQRRADKGEAPCSRATQQVDSTRKVMVQLQSRRRSNGWWVYVSVKEIPAGG
jgi:hypothetical protein